MIELLSIFMFSKLPGSCSKDLGLESLYSGLPSSSNSSLIGITADARAFGKKRCYSYKVLTTLSQIMERVKSRSWRLMVPALMVFSGEIAAVRILGYTRVYLMS